MDSQDRDFLSMLHRAGSATIVELCETLGVTQTAVRQRVQRLQAAGLVDREVERHDRGRPAYRYCLTDDAKRTLGDNYADLARLLWRTVQEYDDVVVRQTLMERLKEAMVEKWRVSGSESTERRVSELGGLLRDCGFDVEVAHQEASEGVGDVPSLPILRENCCPYHDLASEDSQICTLEQEVFEEVLGAPVRLSQRCVDGHSCCEFVVGGH